MKKITKTWLKNFNQYVKQKELNIPLSDDMKNWEVRQRHAKNKNCLNETQIKLLESMYITWNKIEDKWDEKIIDLENWIGIYNRLPRQIRADRSDRTPNDDIENSLAVWITLIRKRYNNGKLPTKYIQKLESLGIIWDAGLSSSMKKDLVFLDKLHDFIALEGRLPRNNSESNYLWSGLKIRKERYDTNNLHPKLNVIFEKYDYGSLDFSRKSYTWIENYNAFKNYILTNGSAPTTTQNKRLHNWFSINRKKYNDNILSESRRSLILGLGLDLRSNEQKWFDRFFEVKKWKEEHDKWPKQHSKEYYEKQLSRWLLSQKNWVRGNFQRNGNYPEYRKKLLMSIGFDIYGKNGKIKRVGWKNQFNCFKEYIDEYGVVPKFNTIYPENNHLGNWFHMQKNLYMNKKLSLEKEMMFKSLNIDLATHGKEFQKKTWEKNFYRVFSNSLQSDSLNSKDKSWIYAQQQKYKNNKLSEDKKALIDVLKKQLK